MPAELHRAGRCLQTVPRILDLNEVVSKFRGRPVGGLFHNITARLPAARALPPLGGHFLLIALFAGWGRFLGCRDLANRRLPDELLSAASFVSNEAFAPVTQ